MSLVSTVLWAQRSDTVYITVDLRDAKNVQLKLERDGKFLFSATGGDDNKQYEATLDLFDKVNVDETKADITSRNVFYIVKKAERKWWPHLEKSGLIHPFVKRDFLRWADEGEVDNEEFGDDLQGKLDAAAEELEAEIKEGNSKEEGDDEI